MAGAKAPLTFRIFKGDQLIREERLSLSVIKLGKVPSAHLKLDDETVSRMHAIIEVNGPGDISIIDLGSTKGTFVNGQKVNKAKLQSGDQIVVGDTRIEGSVAEAEAEDDAPTRVAAAPAAPEGSGGVIASPPRPAAPMVPPAAAPVSSPAGFGMQSAPAPVAHAPAAPAFRPPPGIPAPFGTATASPAAFQASMAESIDDMGGSRAVEVAAMLGDSVVQVKHVMNPRGGKITSMTYGLFGLGAAMILMGAIAFTLAVQNAAYNQGGLDAWTKGDKEHGIPAKPSWSYRPKMLPMGYDWMAFGGFALGLI